MSATTDRRVAWSLLASAVTGLLGWLTVVAVGRSTDPAGYASFAVLWAVFFGVGGAYAGLQQEVTRSVTRSTGRASPGPRLASAAAALVVPGVAALLVLALVTAPQTAAVSGSTGAVAAALGAGLVGLTGLTLVNGVLAARDEWAVLAAVLVGDAVLRSAAVAACLVADRLALLPLAIGVGAFAWVPLTATTPVRAALGAHGADPLPGLVRRALVAMGATACAALLVAGFPALVALARPGALGPVAGALLATLVLVRSPLLVVLYGLRPVLLRALLDADRPAAVVRGWWLRLAGAGLPAAGSAAVVGPPVVTLLLGEAYAVPPGDLAVLAAATVLLAMLVVSGLALVALDRHAASTAGWLVAVAASFGPLLLVPDERPALLLALVVGPAAGLLGHARALVRGPGPGPGRPVTAGP
ncbi:hypothetical protein [Nocardioides sp. SYSU D00038]|uniref:hypothetical protein n=1 Tax=Nocardioides sp. SYSU D00038 TaxID=2812554 RepID=UPI001966D469|nr:hypothetical protein [Nocardioides sp. SYSU D00038]